MQVDYSSLRRVIGSSGSAKRSATSSSATLTGFGASIANYIEHGYSLKEDELAMITIAMEDWRRKRRVTALSANTSVKIGEIYFIDFGFAYKPELAYSHPGIILEEIRGLYLVLPVTTSPRLMSQAYHPDTNPKGVKYLRKVLASDGEGFPSDSVILISNMRTISAGRLHDCKGTMKNITNPNSLFQEVRNTAFKLAFPRIASELSNTYNDVARLQQELDELKMSITTSDIEAK